jgi:large subunit ribosomal protein L25
MSETASLIGEERSTTGKGAARATRRAGNVPGIIYGDKKDPVAVVVEARMLNKELQQPGFFSRLFDLQVNGETIRVITRDLQLDPVTDRPLHIDFLRVSADTRLNVAVSVNFINEEESPGIKRGGVLNIVRHDIELLCAAGNIPAALTVDLTGLDIGDSVHISAIDLPPDVTPTITDRDFTVATVAAPVLKTEEEEEEEAAAAAAAAEAEEGEAALAEGEEAPAEGAEAEAAPAEKAKEE